MTITFHALWMLCALGAVVYSAAAAPRVGDLTALAIGFAIATIVASPQRLLEGRRGDAEARGVRRERESSWRRLRRAHVRQSASAAICDEAGAERNEARREAAVQEYAALWASLPVLAFLIAWKYKRRRLR